MTACGFCFVEYYHRRDAEACLKYLNGAVLDERPLRVDWDAGFTDGRQFGRGRSGRQVRDDHRDDYDPDRGGWGGANPASSFASPGGGDRWGKRGRGDDDDDRGGSDFRRRRG